jgi:hypothetical protein
LLAAAAATAEDRVSPDLDISPFITLSRALGTPLIKHIHVASNNVYKKPTIENACDREIMNVPFLFYIIL